MKTESYSVPPWWFKPIHESGELTKEPKTIEYLKMWTGETFVHLGARLFGVKKTTVWIKNF